MKPRHQKRSNVLVYSSVAIGMLLIVLAFVFLAAKSALFNNFFEAQELTDIAEIINGLTAPVIGFVGALLVYVSFKAQVDANALQHTILNEQRELDLCYKFYEELKADLRQMQAEYGPKYGQSAILDSFMQHVLQDAHSNSPYPEFQAYLYYAFKQFRFIANRAKRSQFLTDSEKAYLIDKLRYLFDWQEQELASLGEGMVSSAINLYRDGFGRGVAKYNDEKLLLTNSSLF